MGATRTLNPSRLWRSIIRVWVSIHEPRVVKAIYFGVYLLTLTTGVITLIDPPQSIGGVLGSWLTTVWSISLIVGGLGAALSVFPGWWWSERLGSVLALLGLGIYALIVLYLHLSDSGPRLTQLGMILIASCVFLVRMAMIRKYTFEPRRPSNR